MEHPAGAQNFAGNQPVAPGISAIAREIPWSNPLDGGKIRVAFVSPLAGLRDAIDFERHIESRLDIVAVPNLSSFPDQSLAGLIGESMDDRVEVIVAGNVDWSTVELGELVPKFERELGIVTVRFGEQRPLAGLEQLPVVDALAVTRGLGMELWPAGSGGREQVRVYEDGAIRVVDIYFATAAPSLHALIPPAESVDGYDWTYSEAYWGLIVRAVRWAGRRVGEDYITGIRAIGPEGPSLEEVPPFLPQEYVESLSDITEKPALRPYEVRFNAPTTRRYEVRYRARYPYRDIPAWLLPLKKTVPKGVSSHVIDVPIGNGEVFLDLWLLDRDDVADWFSAGLRQPAWPEIDTFRCVPNVAMPHGSIHVEFRVRKHFQQPRPALAFVKAKDGYGRLLADRYVQVPAEGGEVAAELAIRDAMGSYVHVELYVADLLRPPMTLWEFERAAYRGAFIPLRSEEESAFAFMADGVAMGEAAALAGHTRLRDLGVTMLHVDPAWDRVAPGAFLAGVPVLPHVADLHAEAVAPGFERVPCLSDPVFWTGAKTSIQGHTAAQWPFGQGLYSLGDGTVLSEEGEEVCRSEACMAAFASTLEGSYASRGALNRAWGMAFEGYDRASRFIAQRSPEMPAAPWLDFRRFMDETFVGAQRRAAGIVRETDGSARVGLCATETGHVSSGMNWPALASQLDYLSVPNDGRVIDEVRSQYRGDALRVLRWQELEDVDRAAWAPWYAAVRGLDGVYAVDEAGALSGMDALGEATPELLSLSDSVRRLQDGFGALMTPVRRVEEPILVVSSQVNRYLRHWVGSENADAPLLAFTGALRTGGYAYRVVPDEALDRIDESGARVLVLPGMPALSARAIEGIQRFSGESTLVIADVPPGVLNEHAVPLDSAPLAGVRIVSPEDASQLYALLAENGVSPVAANVATVGKDFEGERAQFRYGSAEILAFLQSPSAEAKSARIAIACEAGSYVHIVTDEAPRVGQRKETVRLGRGAIALASVLPYEVSRVQIEAPGGVQSGDRIELHVAVRTRDKLPGTHLIRVGIAPVGGERLRHYDRLVECPGGQGDVYIPLALNERPGLYEVWAFDLLSGQSASQTVRVEGRPLDW